MPRLSEWLSRIPFLKGRASRCALAAAALTAVFGFGAAAIPLLARSLFKPSWLDTINMSAARQFIERGTRLKEVRRYLDQQIAHKNNNSVVYELRGLLEARTNGPPAGFDYFVRLLEQRPLQEEIPPLEGFARVCALAGRWDDFFALGRLLVDYGETDRVGAILTELSKAGNPVEKDLKSPAGMRYVAYAEWETSGTLPFPGLSGDQASLFRLWQLERDFRLDRLRVAPAPYRDIAAQRPDDPRAAFLRYYRTQAPDPKAAKTAPPPPLSDAKPLLGPTDFSRNGKQLPDGMWVSNGACEARLPEPGESVWLLAQGTPVLGVYPLIFVKLDDELSIHYLHFPRPFPEFLARRDGKPFQRITVVFVNDFNDPDLKQDRNILFRGVYAAAPGFAGP
ncbi:MAG: hypothetical protein NTW86_30235 [Candidatus Sumerlaeota bacterium]|nr:hypothetical protein [Candidatus Sumerlaeota bacterium]